MFHLGTPHHRGAAVLQRKLRQIKRIATAIASFDRLYDAVIEANYQARVDRARNPLNKYAMRSFSQADEDGITLEICRRIGLEQGRYCEFGVGDGLECNTLALAALGWKGFWISGQELAFRTDDIDPAVFRYYRSWVTSANAVSLYRAGCNAQEIADVDVLSFDLDGNDLYFVGDLLRAGGRPKLFIVEYNARFIPPARWSVELDDERVWTSTDYMGASLQSFDDLFATHNYSLVCCNAFTGNNAFFVDDAYMDRFSDVPQDILEIYQPPNYKVLRAFGHPQDTRTVRRIFFQEKTNKERQPIA